MPDNKRLGIAALVGLLSLAPIDAPAAGLDDPQAERRQPWLVPAGEAVVSLAINWGAEVEGEQRHAAPSAGTLTLAGGQTLELRTIATRAVNARQTVYTASAGGDPDDRLILSRAGDAWHGLLMTRGGWQELTGVGADPTRLTLAAHAVDQTLVPRCGGALTPDGFDAERAHTADATHADGSRADGSRGITEYTLLACYTSQARRAAGGADAIVARVLSAVELTNITYELSEIDVRVRLVGTLETPAREDDLGTFNSNLSFFTASGNDFYPQAEPARDLLGADLMTLLIDRNELCGIAWLFTGSEYRGTSVCAWGCVGNTGTLAHEIGHNLGCAHDRPNANTSTEPYGFGHRFTGGDGTLYRTIMAYAPGTPLARFSNPDVSFAGVPTGVPIGAPGEAHNAQVIRDNAPLVAQFRIDEAPDANGNFIDDRDDIASGRSRDENADGVPDEVQSPILRVATPDQLDAWPDAIADASLAFAAAASDASAVTEVRFAAGTYPITAIGGEPMPVQAGTAYLGGYDPQTGERDPAATPTVFTGDLLGNDDPADPATLDDNTPRMGEAYHPAAGTLLDGFVFRDARAFGDELFAAGFFVQGVGELTFRDCVFTDLTADFGDPALAIERSALVRLERCRVARTASEGGSAGIGLNGGGRVVATDTAFEDNVSGFIGGAVSFFGSGSGVFERCVFARNSAARHGGAIRSPGAGLDVRDSVFVDNHAEEDGGAISIAANPIPLYRFDGCEFLRNDGGRGGAIAAEGAPRVQIARTRFAGNSAAAEGGAIALTAIDQDVGDASLTIHASQLLGNTAAGAGGAVHAGIPNTNLSVASSVIAFNEAGGVGGAIDLAPASIPAIDGSLIYANTAQTTGGLSAPAPQFAQFSNTVYWNNADAGSNTRSAQIDAESTGFAIIGRNCVQDDAPGDGDAWNGATNTDLDPRILAPATPGADGIWGTEDDTAGDWRASPGSPMIDAGDAGLLLRDPLDLDGDGNLNEAIPFGVDGNARTAGTAPDIGAAEAAPACALADLAEPFGSLDPADIAAFVAAFTAGGSAADLTVDATLDLDDIVAFVVSFEAGCP